MYNKKSMASAITLTATAAVIIGMMIMVFFLKYSGGNNQLGVVFFVFLFSSYGTAIFFVSAVPFVVVALVFGIKMLRCNSRERLIRYNVRALIATCVLLPFFALSMAYYCGLVSMSALELFPSIYIVAVVAMYGLCVITPIISIILLKKSPEQPITEAV